MRPVAHSDLVIHPGQDLASLLGAVFIAYALIVYPVIGLLGGHPLRPLPVFGQALPTVIFFFALLLWSRPPAPKYLLVVPLAWVLVAASPELGKGVAADCGLVVVATITAGLLIWRDPTLTWRTVTAGLLLAVMIAWYGHDIVLIGAALVLVAVTLAQSHRQPRSPHARPDPPAPDGQVEGRLASARPALRSVAQQVTPGSCARWVPSPA